MTQVIVTLSDKVSRELSLETDISGAPRWKGYVFPEYYFECHSHLVFFKSTILITCH